MCMFACRCQDTPLTSSIGVVSWLVKKVVLDIFPSRYRSHSTIAHSVLLPLCEHAFNC